VAMFGAQCLAIIDLPGNPQRHRTNQMLGTMVLGTGAVIITGAASPYPLLLGVVVIVQCFFYSLFSVFGKSGGLIGFTVLLLMVLTMRAPMPLEDLLAHAAATLGGALTYLAFNLAFSRFFPLREEQQTLSVAIFATADYVATSANFYDENIDLNESYRTLIQRQSVMTEQHQTARNVVLRALPRGQRTSDRRRMMLWNLFIDMVQLTDTLIAMHTDYAALRRTLAGNNCLIFIRDALINLSVDLNQIALGVSGGRPVRYGNSAKAELHAIKYEIEQLKQQGLGERDPSMLAMILQVQRRLRHSMRTVGRLAEHTTPPANTVPARTLHLDKSLSRFLSRQEFRLGLLTCNLRLDSPHFRYAARVTLAVAMAMTLTSRWLSPALAAHNYWILTTVVIILKPGFALTRQRGRWRLAGTLIGCVLALLILQLTDHLLVLFAGMFLACVMGNSFVLINNTISAVGMTVFALLLEHLASPGSVPIGLVGERAVDTTIGFAIAFLCSYIFPWWEARSLSPLARAAVAANREYLQAGLHYVRTRQTQASPSNKLEAATATITETDVAWRLARNNAHLAFSNFAASFYLMMSEPKSRQTHVPELHNLLIQNHLLASQITAAIPLLAALPKTPPPIQLALEGMVELLDYPHPPPTVFTQFDPQGELAALGYSLKQMANACHMMRHELASIDPATHAMLPVKSQTA
jgi:uncharacterized membrane protein YccC